MAWLIAYLASPAGDFFSGAVLTIDGARDTGSALAAPNLADESGRLPRRSASPSNRSAGLGHHADELATRDVDDLTVDVVA